MPIVLLISPEYVYQNSHVNASVESSKITPFIRVAQDKYIEALLGTDLIQKLQSDGNAAAGNYLTLRDNYVRPCLLWYTLQELMPTLNYKVDNGNLAQHNSDNTQAIGQQEMNRLITDAKNNAIFYAKRLQDYLCNYSNLFPEYSTNTGNDVSPHGRYIQTFAFTGNNHDMRRDHNPRDNKLNRYLP